MLSQWFWYSGCCLQSLFEERCLHSSCVVFTRMSSVMCTCFSSVMFTYPSSVMFTYPSSVMFSHKSSVMCTCPLSVMFTYPSSIMFTLTHMLSVMFTHLTTVDSVAAMFEGSPSYAVQCGAFSFTDRVMMWSRWAQGCPSTSLALNRSLPFSSTVASRWQLGVTVGSC